MGLAQSTYYVSYEFLTLVIPGISFVLCRCERSGHLLECRWDWSSLFLFGTVPGTVF